MTQALVPSALVNRPSRTVNDYLTFLDRVAKAVDLELVSREPQTRPGVKHQKRYEPTG